MEEKTQLQQEMEKTEQDNFELVKSNFKGNLGLVKTIRKAMYQLPLNAVDLANLISLKSNAPLLTLLRANFCPELSENTPLGQQPDFFTTVKVKEVAPDIAVWQFKGMKLWQDYVKQQMEAIEAGACQKEYKIRFSDLVLIEDDDTDERIFTKQFARTNIFGTVDGRLSLLYMQANAPKETEEQKRAREAKNSSK